MTTKEDTSRSTQLIRYLFLGSIILLYGELWTASSAIPPWFINPLTYLLFPLTSFALYLINFLFFFNIAYRSGELSLPQLYLYGCLIGLYEAPLTKVLWTASGDDMVIAGINLVEFTILVFFWHPIFSFILPMQVFQVLSSETKLLNSTVPLLIGDRAKYVLIIPVFVGLGFFPITAGGALLIAWLSLLGTMLIVLLFYHLLANRGPFSLQSFILTKRQLIVLCVIMIAEYLLFWLLFPPQAQIPTTTQLVATIFSYLLIITILWRSDPISSNHVSSDDISSPQFFTTASSRLAPRSVFLQWAVMLIGLLIAILFLPIFAVYGFLLYVFIALILAPALFLTMSYKSIRLPALKFQVNT